MSLSIQIQTSPPAWDALTVNTLRYYPYTEGPYRPFTGAQMAIYRDALYINLKAFENEQYAQDDILKSSCINVFLKSEHSAVALSFCCDGRIETSLFTEDLEQKPIQKATQQIVQTNWFSGEDNQGIYWGVTAVLTVAFLRDTLKIDKISQNNIISGNVTKTQFYEDAFHYGSLFEMVEEMPLYYAPQSFKKFDIVNI